MGLHEYKKAAGRYGDYMETLDREKVELNAEGRQKLKQEYAYALFEAQDYAKVVDMLQASTDLEARKLVVLAHVRNNQIPEAREAVDCSARTSRTSARSRNCRSRCWPSATTCGPSTS